jgi:hypothetical protein
MKQTEIIPLLIRIDERQLNMEGDIKGILEQTIKTNGRVTVLEGWRNRLKGAWAALVIIGTVCGIVLGYILKHVYG